MDVQLTAKKAVTKILDILLPSSCPLCRNFVAMPHTLCSSCFADLPLAPASCCLRCGGNTAQVEVGCGGCLGDDNFPDRVYFPFLYHGGIARLVVGYKFADRSQWAPLLVELSWSRMSSELLWEEPDFVLPIPLHPRRFLARRYNQSALLAMELAKKINRPMVTNGLIRIKMTKPQTKLSLQGRRENVLGAFLANQNVLSGRSVLLVDDVFTTGATMMSAVKELRRAGVKRVAVFCVARTVLFE